MVSICEAQTVIENSWTLQGSGPEYDWLDDVVVDDSGYIYFCATLEGGSRIAVGRLTPALELDWIIPSYFGVNFGYCVGLALDSSWLYVATNSGQISNSNAVVYRHNKRTGARTFAVYDNARGTHDHITDIVLDRQSNVIITGTSYYKSDSSESFILKYSQNLSRQWGKTYLDRIVVDNEYNSLAVDDSGNVFVTGKRTMKFSPSGDLRWTRAGADRIVLDGSGRAVTAAFEAPYWMVDKYDQDGNDIWGGGLAYFDGTTMGPIVKMVIDDLDNVYLCGTKAWPNTFWHTVKIDGLGNDVWSADLSSPAGQRAYVYDLAVDRRLNVYVTGTMVDVATDEFKSAVTVRYDPTGAEVWRQMDGAGNSRDEYGGCIAVDESLSVLVGGFRSESVDRYSGELVVWKFRQTDRFRADRDGWHYLNWDDPMWTPAWWAQFDYSKPPYPPAWVSFPIWARPFDWPDWPVFVRAFGESQCYLNPLPGTRVYNPFAVRYWRSLVQGSRYVDSDGIQHHWRGSCYGFSISSLLIYNGYLKIPERFPGYDRTYDVTLCPESRNMIHSYQISQFGVVHQAVTTAWFRKPLHDSFDEIHEMLNIKHQNNQPLSIFNNNGPGGHTVVACSLASVSADLVELYVYDSNFPGQEMTIDIDPTHWTWSYDGLAGWGGSAGLVLKTPLELAFSQPVLPLTTSGFSGIILFSTPNAATVIENPGGERLGFLPSGGVLIDSMQGAWPIIPVTGAESPPIGYMLPDGAYDIEVSGVLDSTYEATLFSESTMFVLSRAGCSESESDILTTEPSLQRLRYRNPDAASKMVDLSATSGLPGRAMSCKIGSVAIGSSDSLDLGIVDLNQFEIRNNGPGKTYNLRLEYAFEPGYRIFTHANLTLDSSSAHLLAPDWEYMEDGSLPIYVDRDGDGSPDDTLVVGNEFVTGIRDQEDELVPEEVFLDQNYPNPFNALTTIRFGIPEQVRLRISVYNILGQEVALLADGVHEAGFSTVRWDATGFPTGIYVCRLQAQSTRDGTTTYAKVTKLLFVK